ncbi:hypothetical protein PR048_030275 [Dryococelus australis]|uniref:Uncharacterized protein n=1 Tax=Dryococelus australis TaxID=614101 RepID=A0ABQ9G8J0_9NEOP|nr:hypothetical protein PR048_030275 [Dryococelus australis]
MTGIVHTKAPPSSLLDYGYGHTTHIPPRRSGFDSPEFSHVGIVPDDAAGRWVFSGISSFPPGRFISALLRTHLSSSSAALKVDSPTTTLQANAGAVNAWGGGGRGTVAEPLDCPPPAKVNRVDSPARITQLVGGFSRDIPFPPPSLHSGAAPFSPQFALIGSRDCDKHTLAQFTEHRFFSFSRLFAVNIRRFCACAILIAAFRFELCVCSVLSRRGGIHYTSTNNQPLRERPVGTERMNDDTVVKALAQHGGIHYTSTNNQPLRERPVGSERVKSFEMAEIIPVVNCKTVEHAIYSGENTRVNDAVQLAVANENTKCSRCVARQLQFARLAAWSVGTAWSAHACRDERRRGGPATDRAPGVAAEDEDDDKLAVRLRGAAAQGRRPQRQWRRVVQDASQVSWCLLSAVHARITQQEPETIVEPGETGCIAATHERAARHPLHTCCDVNCNTMFKLPVRKVAND